MNNIGRNKNFVKIVICRRNDVVSYGGTTYFVLAGKN